MKALISAGRCSVGLLGWILAWAAPAAAQEPIWYWTGEAEKDWFGLSACGAGDVNADGRPDVIVGAPYHSAMSRGREHGRVRC